MKANRYLHDHDISVRTLAKVAAKNYRNGVNNPNAFRRKPISEQQILDSPMLNYPLTHYMFCAPDEGAAAVIMCRADIAHRFTSKPVYVRSVEVRTRTYGAYEVNTTYAPVDEVPSPSAFASRAAFEAAGISPQDIDVVQLQDTDAGAEVIHMAEAGFCADGDQEKLIADGATEIGGSLPVNTDGGLIANGEPIGAPGYGNSTNSCFSCAETRGHGRCRGARVRGSPCFTARRGPRGRPLSPHKRDRTPRHK